MSNFNKVLLMGRLTRDPELRYTPKGTAVADIGLAINREYSAGTERRKDTTFVDVTFWARQAEIVCEYLRKGSPLFVEGRLAFVSWETQEGQKRSRLRVVAENFQFVGGRGQGSEAAEPEQAGADYGQSYRQGTEEGGPDAPTPQESSGSPGASYSRSPGSSQAAASRPGAGGYGSSPLQPSLKKPAGAAGEVEGEGGEEGMAIDENDIPF